MLERVEPIFDHMVSPVFQPFRNGGPLCAYFLIGQQQLKIFGEPPLALVEIWIEMVHPLFPALVGSLEVALLHKEPEGNVLPVYSFGVPSSLQKFQDDSFEEVDFFDAPLAPESVYPRNDNEELISQVHFWLIGEETGEDSQVKIVLDS